MQDKYIFRIEKQSQEHPLTPQILVEFACAAENPKGLIDAVVAFTELLKLLGSPEKVVEYIKHNASVRDAKLFVDSLN